MGHLRTVFKLPLFAFATAVFGLAHVLTVPACRGIGLRHVASRTSAWIFRTWSKVSLLILGARVEVRGPLPSPPFFLVTNHLGYMDVLVLASVLDCVFVSKADVAGWPIVGPLVSMVGTVFIDRELKRDIPRVLGRIAENLEHGRGIVIFPEGTSSQGTTVLPFRAPLLEVAARTGMPVSYGALTYRTSPGNPPAHLAVCWWGDMPFGTHFLKLFRLPGLEARVTFGESTIREANRKHLASKARDAVLGQFEPVAPTTL